MTSKTMCILFSESYGAAPNELASERTLATVPFAGRYRLIDLRFLRWSRQESSISEFSPKNIMAP